MQPGIDVSHWSGDINWQSVKNSGSVKFVFAKATEGLSFVDDQWLNNKRGCQDTGIPHGAYHYFRPQYDPTDQADHLIQTAGADIDIYVCDVETYVLSAAYERIRGQLSSTRRLASRFFSSLDTPVLLGRENYEEREHAYINAIVKGNEYERVSSVAAGDIQALTLAQKVKIFMERIQGRVGKMGVIYTSPGFWNTYVHPSWTWAMPYDLWVAHWTGASEPIIPKTWDDWVFWQYTNALTIPGIPSKTDGDRAKNSLDLYGYFGNGQEVPPPGKFLVQITANYLNMRATPYGTIVGKLRKDNILFVTKIVKDGSGRDWYYSGDYGCFASWWAKPYE